jgi:hypothetical protein
MASIHIDTLTTSYKEDGNVEVGSTQMLSVIIISL